MTTACPPLTADQQQLAAQWRFLPLRVYRQLAHRSDVRLLGPEDAEGAGLVALARAAVHFDPQHGAAFPTYAYKAVLHGILRAADDWSRRSADLSLDGIGDGDGEPFQVPAPEVGGLDLLEAERVRSALDTLPARRREVLRRRYYEGETLDQVGLALDFSGENARRLEAGALRSLRRSLGVL